MSHPSLSCIWRETNFFKKAHSTTIEWFKIISIWTMWLKLWRITCSSSGRTPNVDMTCPTKLSVKTDAHTEISCQVLSKTFAKITWFHNGHPISNQRKSHVTVDRKSCDQTLKIKFAKTSDGGHYTCQVANSNGTINKTCVLDVQGKSALFELICLL